MLRSQKGTKGKHERHRTNMTAKCAGNRNCQKTKQGGAWLVAKKGDGRTTTVMIVYIASPKSASFEPEEGRLQLELSEQAESLM